GGCGTIQVPTSSRSWSVFEVEPIRIYPIDPIGSRSGIKTVKVPWGVVDLALEPNGDVIALSASGYTTVARIHPDGTSAEIAVFDGERAFTGFARDSHGTLRFATLDIKGRLISREVGGRAVEQPLPTQEAPDLLSIAPDGSMGALLAGKKLWLGEA